LLVSWAATLGAYIWSGPEAVLNQHIFKVQSSIDRRFHKYLLDYKLAELQRSAHGSGMVHITRARFDSVKVAVPASREQRRIVDILDDHLSRLDAAVATLETGRRRLSALDDLAVLATLLGENERAASVQSEISQGALPALPEGWVWCTLGEVAEVIGGVTKDAKKQSDPSLPEVPYLRVANVQRARLDLAQVTTIRVPTATAQRLRLEPGDVLLNEGGDRDKLARGWVWNGEVPDCIHQNHVFRARPNTALIDPYWLSWCTNSYGSVWAQHHGKQSVNLASISLSMVRTMPIPVPPLDEQVELLAKLTEGLQASGRLTVAIDTARKRSTLLRRALLAAAFSGQLTGAAEDSERIEELAAAL
jgi:type I restriction enzyme S subunit